MGIAYYAALGAIAVLLLVILRLLSKLEKQIKRLKKAVDPPPRTESYDKKNKSKS